MKRNWIRLGIAMLLIAAPALAAAQEPPVDVLKPVDVLIPSPVADPTVPPADVDVFALANGDVITWKAAEPSSPSDSLNDPARPATWTFQAAPQAPRDGFEERIARLEAQVAELSRQLRSGGGPTTPTVPAAPAAVRAIRTAPAVALTQAAPVARARTAAIPPAAATATVAPGAPIVIHVYVHPSPAPSATTSGAAYYYSVTPPAASAAIAPQATRVRMAVPIPGTAPTIYSVPGGGAPTVAVPGQPLTPARTYQFVPATPASPAAPATPAVPATPALPGVPGVPSPPRASTPAPAGSLAPVTISGASRVAWDDVPGEAGPKDE